MNKRKMAAGGAVVAGIVAVIAVMAFVKNRRPGVSSAQEAQSASSAPGDAQLEQVSEPDAGMNQLSVTAAQKATQTKVAEKTPPGPAENAILNGSLNLTGPFDLAELRSAGVPVVIDFGADSCIPCKEMAPVLAALHDELKGKAIIRFVDVWKYRELADGIPLQVIPTQVFFDAAGKPFTPSAKLQIPMTRYADRDTNEPVFTTHEGGITREQLLAALDEMGMKK
jgi:thioredoxin 1